MNQNLLLIRPYGSGRYTVRFQHKDAVVTEKEVFSFSSFLRQLKAQLDIEADSTLYPRWRRAVSQMNSEKSS